jgi:WD40 repeat protein
MALSDDARLIASGCDDGIVVLWDLEDDEKIQEKVHSDYVRDIRFEHGKSGWEQRFVTVGDDGLISMRKHREELWRVKYDDGTRAVDFTPDNRHIWVGKAEMGDNLVLIDASNGARLERLAGHSDWINALRISPDGRWMATGSDDHTVRIWDLQTKSLKHTLKGHEDEVNAVAWHPDSRMLAVTADDGRLTVWDTQTGQKLVTVQEGNESDGESVVFVNDGSELVWADDIGGLRRYRWAPTAATGKPPSRSKPPASGGGGSSDGVALVVRKTRAITTVRSIAVSESGEHIAVGTSSKKVFRCDNQTLATETSHSKHTDWVRALAISSCGIYIASGCDDGHVCFWDSSDDEKVFKESVHTDYVRVAAIIPGGAGYRQKYVTGGDDYRVLMHQRGAVLWDTNVKKQVHSLAWTSDQATIYVGLGTSNNNIVCLNAADGAIKHRLPGHDDWIRALATNPAGDRLASGADTGEVKIWNISSGSRNTTPLHTLNGHTAYVKGLSWHPTEPKLASVGEDGRVHIWNTDSGELLGLLELSGKLHAVAFSQDGSELYVGGKTKDGPNPAAKFHRIGLQAGKRPVRSSQPSNELLSTLKKRSNNKGLAVSVPKQGDFFAISYRDKSVERCRRAALTHDKRHTSHTDWVRGLSMSDDGRLIASGCDDGHIVILDTNDGEELVLRGAHTDYVRSVAFERNGSGYKQRLVSGGDDNRVVMRRRREVVWETDVGGQARAVLFSATNRFIWVGVGLFGDNLVVLNAETGKKIATLPGHEDWINAIDISPNGRFVASGSDDNKIKIWTPSDRKLVQTLEGHTDDVNDVAWHPDNRTLAAAGEEGRISVWDTQTGNLLAKKDFGGDAQAVSFIEGGKVLLAVGDPMGVLRLKWK